MSKEYKGIIFAKGYNKPFAEFKNEFASNHIFKKIPSAQREAELKKAHKIAISDNNGNISGPTKESKEDNSGKSEQGSV
jgi:hypothetical protein